MTPELHRTIDEWKARLAASGKRAWPEWIGKTGDSKPPQSVVNRIFALWGGRCYLTGVKLLPGHWDLEHVIALANGGENREGNLRPVWRQAHKAKTKKDRKEKARVDALIASAAGIEKPKRKIPNPEPQRKQRTHAGRPSLPPVQLYGEIE